MDVTWGASQKLKKIKTTSNNYREGKKKEGSLIKIDISNLFNNWWG